MHVTGIDMGAIGVVLKSDLLDLVEAVQSAAAGRVYLSRSLTSEM